MGSQDVHGAASSVQIGDMVDPVAADNADAAGGGGGGLVFDEIFDDEPNEPDELPDYACSYCG